MMQLLLFVVHSLFLPFSNFVACEDLFSPYDNTNVNSVDDLGFGALALGDSGNVAQQPDLLDFDSNFTPNTNMWSLTDDSPISFDTSSNVLENTGLIAGGCPSSNKFGKRNEATSCPNSDQDKIGIPTFEELMGAVEFLHKTLEDKICAPPRLFHLCCICGEFNGFGLCDHCEQCTFPFPHISAAALVLVVLNSARERCSEREREHNIFEQNGLLKYEYADNALTGCYTPHIQVCCKTFGLYWRVSFSEEVYMLVKG